MNFQEAVILFTKIRRPYWKPGYFIEPCDNGLIHSSEYYQDDNYAQKVRAEYRVMWKDVLANDWELFEEVEKEVYINSGVVLNGEELFKKVKV